MQNKNTAYLPRAVLHIAVTLAATVAHFCLLLYSYDAVIGHFSGAAETGLYIGAVLLVLLPALFYAGTGFPAGNIGPKSVGKLLLAADLIFSAICFTAYPTGSDSAVLPVASVFRVLIVVSAACCAITMFCGILKPDFPVAAGCLSLHALLYAMFLYFDTSLSMNSPQKLLMLLACIAVALASLADCRVLSGRGGEKLRKFLLPGAASLAVAVALPQLLYAIVSGTGFPHTPTEECFLLVFAVYGITHVKPIRSEDNAQ